MSLCSFTRTKKEWRIRKWNFVCPLILSWVLDAVLVQEELLEWNGTLAFFATRTTITIDPGRSQAIGGPTSPLLLPTPHLEITLAAQPNNPRPQNTDLEKEKNWSLDTASERAGSMGNSSLVFALLLSELAAETLSYGS